MELKEELKPILEEFKSGLPKGINAEELEAKFNAFEETLKGKFEQKDYSAELAELKNAIKVVEEKSGRNSQKMEMKSLRDFFVDTEVLKGLKEKKQAEFEIKAVGTETTANVVVADTAPKLSVLGVQGNLYAVNRSVIDSILNYVDMGTTDKASVVYVNEVNGEGTVTTTAEGVAKNQIDLDFKEVTVNADKYTALVKVSEEALDDIGYMEGEINRVMNEKLAVAESAAVLTAILAAATTFSLTDFDDKVNDADVVDAVVAAKAQSVLSGFMPKHIVMHPVDIAKIFLAKSANSPRVATTANGMTIDGLQIIATTQITKDNFVLGDFGKYRVRSYKRKLVMGWDADDFSKNLRTIIAEHRFAKYVSDNEKTSFIKGVFSTIIAALETP